MAPVFVNNVQLVEWESRDLSSIVVMSHISSVDYAGWHLPCYAVHNCPRRLQGGGGGGSAAYADEGDDVLVHQGTRKSRFNLQGDPYGRGMVFVDIKLSIPSQYLEY